MLATKSNYARYIIAGLLSWVNAGIPQCKGLKLQAGLSISNSAARQLLCTQRTLTWNATSSQHNGRGGCQIRPRLQLHEVHVCWSRQNLGCVALAVSFPGFHPGRRLICCTDWTVMLIRCLLWEFVLRWTLDCCQPAVKVSKSRHNSRTKLQNQTSTIEIQVNTETYVLCMFQRLVSSEPWDFRPSHRMTNWQTDRPITICLWRMHTEA